MISFWSWEWEGGALALLRTCAVLGPAQVRAETEAAITGAQGHEFDDIDLAEAASALRTALAQRPCPRRPEQRRGVDTYVELVRARADQLAGRSPGSRGRNRNHSPQP